MSADTAYRAVAEHLPDAAVVLFDHDLRLQLATGTTLPDPAWCADTSVGRTVVDQAIGGQFTLHSAPGAGTRVHVQAPSRARP